MLSNILEKNMQVVSTKDGSPTALLFDITNKQVREYFEDLLDTMDAESRMNNSTGRPFAEFKKEYLAKKQK
jgi:hypothetical protein